MDIEKAKINLETSKIHWVELQRFFAAGKVLQVAPSHDLTKVALDMSLDDASAIGELINSGEIEFISDVNAKKLLESNALVWSVVVKPYVLIQEISE